MKKDSLRTENDFNNVKKEIKMLKMINHPNILRLIKSCEDKENVYIIMEYASNHSVWNYIQKKKRLSEINAFVLFIQVCLALDYIHKLGFIHRNINVFFEFFIINIKFYISQSKTLWIDSNGHLKLGDLAWCGKLEELRLFI